MAQARPARRLIQMAVFTVVWIAALFGAAGTFEWKRGWIFVALSTVGMGTTGTVVRRIHPDLLEARAKWRRADTKRFDKAFLAIFVPLSTIQPAVAGLDAVRFHWSEMPFWTVYPGMAILVPSIALMAWCMAVNRHAETTVRIQTDRGHTVVDRGPYRFVRHPMYVGVILMYPASALILGSELALVLSGVILLLFIWRTAMEDATLRRELAGYQEYAARTRYRLLPGVW